MVKIGRVRYLNTLPLFYAWDESRVKLVEGVPSELVKMLRENLIQGGIVSSIEYLLKEEEYRLVPNISISSRIKACSVVILSKKPIHSINKLYLTQDSMTSQALALYIVRRVYKANPDIVKTREEADAVLLIGDEALKEANRWPYLYDLGEEWYKLYKLPFVFALFIVKKWAPQWLDEYIEGQCKASKEKFFKDLEEGKLHIEGYTDTFLKQYFYECLHYELNTAERESLKLFKEILIKENIL